MNIVEKYPIFRQTLIIRPNEMKFVVFTHRRYDTGQLLYVGWNRTASLLDVFDMQHNERWAEAMKDAPALLVEIVGFFEYRTDAIYYASQLRNTLHPISLGSRIGKGKVVCTTNGEVFNSASHAARAYNIAASTMANHLRGRKGYDTIRGLRFERTNMPSAQIEKQPEGAAYIPPPPRIADTSHLKLPATPPYVPPGRIKGSHPDDVKPPEPTPHLPQQQPPAIQPPQYDADAAEETIYQNLFRNNRER